MMAVMLENMPNITLMARTLISAVYRTAQIMASIPNLSYQNKARQHLLSNYFSYCVGDFISSILVPYLFLIPSKYEML